jgi:4-hydroxy-4-methyl-2-oxoglutarate aldolase
MSGGGLAFVLVHGAWHNAASWAQIVPMLEAEGYGVRAVDLPGAGAGAKVPTSYLNRPIDARAFASEPSPNADVDQEKRTRSVIAIVEALQAVHAPIGGKTHVHTLVGSHSPFLSQPNELVRILREIAHEAEGERVSMTDTALGPAIDTALLAMAAKLSAATLHEAAHKAGALPAAIKPVDTAMRLCGRAFPVKCPPGDNLWIHRALAQAGPGDVLVVSVGEGVEFGYWGEIMGAAAKSRGISGLVISGGVRDVEALRRLGLPTFSACVSIRGTVKDRAGDGAIGEPVRIGDIAISRGDLVVGDADGVVVLTPDVACAAVVASFARDEQEAAIIERVRAGALTLDVYNL